MAAQCCVNRQQKPGRDTFDILSCPAVPHCRLRNIEGINEQNLSIRLRFIASEIKRIKPAIVFLQEVTSRVLENIFEELSEEYNFFYARNAAQKLNYFCSMLLRVDEVWADKDSEAVIWFKNSAMGRHALCLKVRLLSHPNDAILLMTSHLESTKPRIAERGNQLQICFDILQSAMEDGSLHPELRGAIFGGDLNVSDSEGIAKRIPPGVHDLWEYLGSPKKYEYTWDCLLIRDSMRRGASMISNSPRLRFDRLYWKTKNTADSGQDSWWPASFMLLNSKISKFHNMFPSDHFGVLVTFRRGSADHSQ